MGAATLEFVCAMYLRLLIIEDNDRKYEHVCAALAERLSHHTVLPERASYYEDAIAKLSGSVYDVVLLDIMLPRQGGEPDAGNARAIIQRIMSGSCAGTPVVFGLTEFQSSIETEAQFFNANLFSVLHYDPLTSEWASMLAARIEYLLDSRGLGAFVSSDAFHSDLCIVVARKRAEFEPVVRKLKWFGDVYDEHALFPMFTLRRGAIEVAPGRRILASVVCVGSKGLAPTAAATASALLAFRPRMVAMLGVCCGLAHNWANCALGDVVVAQMAELWDGGRYEESNKKTAFVHESNGITARLGGHGDLEHFIEAKKERIESRFAKSWARKKVRAAIPVRLESSMTPRLKLGQVVSGLSVVDSQKMQKEVARRFPAALALDMEVAGFYTACLRSPVKSAFVAIKAVADFGDGKKQSGEFDALQPFATELTVEVLGEMLRK